MTVYSSTFYASTRQLALSSAGVVLPMVYDLMHPLTPASVVDIGCGDGAWLSVAGKRGMPRLLGVDGSYVQRGDLLIAPTQFHAADLRTSAGVNGRFDLAMCLEVAEHLPASRADSLVKELTDLAPVVLFSAAIPGQGGTEHINEQWPTYWAQKFASRGFACVDALRPKLMPLPTQTVAWWYAQNLLLFVREDRLADYPKLHAARASLPAPPASYVHPALYESVLKRSRRPGRTLVYDLRKRLKGG